MAAAQTNGSAPDPKSVGNAFIKQYYSILHDSPQVAHRFYHDISELSRPGPDGQMISVTTSQVRIYWKGVFFHVLRTWSHCLFGSRLIIGGGWGGWNSRVTLWFDRKVWFSFGIHYLFYLWGTIFFSSNCHEWIRFPDAELSIISAYFFSSE